MITPTSPTATTSRCPNWQTFCGRAQPESGKMNRLHEKSQFGSMPCFSCEEAHYLTRNRTHGSDFPFFFSRRGSPYHRCPLLFVCISGNNKGLARWIGRVRFLMKPRFFGTRLLA